jgi:hypothetical protein
VVTLDNIAANLDIKHIDLVIMDVEAHEIYALEGMKNCYRTGKASRHKVTSKNLATNRQN